MLTEKQILRRRKTRKARYKRCRDIILEQQKKYYNNNKEKRLDFQKRHRNINKDVIKVKRKKYYNSNKQEILAHQYLYNKNRWENDEEYRKKRTVYNGKIHYLKLKRDKELRDRLNKKALDAYYNHQSKTINRAVSLRPRFWEDGEIEYLLNNYYNKTVEEMALHLGRTFSSTKSCIFRKILKIIDRKNRNLKSIYLNELKAKQDN